MRVLADRHHAGLYESLARLFEDRFGWTLYTPIGHEWWDEGYWRFGEGTWGDDRLARQFLNADAFDAAGVTYDPEFPERPIRGVTLARARAAGEWDYVVATVSDNQHGLARFAREMGATFVMQVGNTGQLIDWGLEPVVLNSSEMPMLGRGIHYHQEFDSEGTFGFREPADRHVISSFVNCFPSIACYPLFLDYRAALPEFTFRVYGIDGPDGNVKPSTAIAERMAESGWAWHDKQHGDGFGHVIHAWAAVGRPLIGHASHYRGKLAEGLWQDGETCIDLDRHTLPEVVEMLRGMTPERHREMCRAIRARFDELVDYEREAAAIKELLTA